ncbi:MAG: 2-oxoglutarate dehydrogenase complex dihydrolipoyllysine-residue succinyltransferase [Phycisphaerae bacterium]
MAFELKVPSVGESVTKVQIGQWLKGAGERAERDQPVVEIETDKATIELPAPVGGVVSKVLKNEGDSAMVGEVIGWMEEAAAGADAGKPAKAAPSSAGAAAPAQSGAPAKTGAPAGGAGPAKTATPAQHAASPRTVPPDAARVMPAARRALAEVGVGARDVRASGPGGRLLKEDVARHTADGGPRPPRDDSPSPHARAGANGREEDAVAMTPLRRRVAERLVQSQQTAALLTTFNEIDMAAVMELRKQYQEAFQAQYGVKLGFMSFFIKATIDALRLIPQVNAEIRDLAGPDGAPTPHIVYRNYYDIGVAVGGGKGLVVPVIRNAEHLSFAELELAIADFGARARDNKLKLEELYGGTFTISNGGIYGSLMSTPIINPPQSGILGLHAIQDRPVAREGQVVIRPMMYVALTYDHRLIDGREAVTFLKRIKECVENPTRMLVEV